MHHIDRHLLELYFEGGCTPQQAREVEAWLDQQAGLPPADSASWSEQDKAALQKDLWKRIDPGKQHTPVWQGIRFRLFSAAACLLLVAALLFRYFHGGFFAARAGERWITYVAPPGKRSVLKLSDSTSIELNAGAIVQYPESFAASARRVTLSGGDAFFNIGKDTLRPFIVALGDAQVTVLATSFGISRTPANIGITLVEGKIRFGHQEEQMILHPGERLSYNPLSRKITEVKPVNTQKEMAWRGDSLSFEEAPLQHVLTVLGQHYGVRFRLRRQQDAALLFTGHFRNESLAHVLQLITLSTGLSCVEQDSVIVVQ